MGDDRVIIVLDCDNVLLDFTSVFVEWWNDKRFKPKIKLPIRTYTFDLPATHHQVLSERIAAFQKTHYMRNLPLMYRDIPEVLAKMLAAWPNIMIISEAPLFVRPHRVANLAKCGIDTTKISIHCVQSKADYLKKYILPHKDRVLILVDDKPSIIAAAWAAGMTVFYPDLLYTRGSEKFGKPFTSFSELYDLIARRVAS